MLLATVAAFLLLGPATLPVSQVRVLFVDVASAGAPVVLEAARESARILAGAGVLITWGTARAGEETEAPDVRVVLLPRAPGPTVPAHILAATEPGATASAWVYLPHLRRALGAATGEQLARALGRVVAHEIVHAIAPALPHSGAGLMRPTLSSHALRGPELHLDERSAAALHRAVARRQPPAIQRAERDASGVMPPVNRSWAF